jgi:2-methylisocitrate lyase-like PEP mutase family enzyme
VEGGGHAPDRDLSTVPAVSIEERAAAFQALHEGPGIFVMPNPWDAGTARVLAGLGFEALATTSQGMANSMGTLDGEVRRKDALEHAREIVDATPLPVSGDLENGYGDDPDTVAKTIRKAAKAGLVGCSIEDATKNPEDPIYAFDLAAERIKAAAKAARKLAFPFVLTARAENYLYGRPDLPETIARLKAYEEAGADVLYAPGLRELDDIRKVCEALSKPVNVLALKGGPSVGELAEAGVRRVSLGSNLHRVAMGAFVRGAKELKEQGTLGFLDGAASSGELEPFLSSRD